MQFLKFTDFTAVSKQWAKFVARTLMPRTGAGSGVFTGSSILTGLIVLGGCRGHDIVDLSTSLITSGMLALINSISERLWKTLKRENEKNCQMAKILTQHKLTLPLWKLFLCKVDEEKRSYFYFKPASFFTGSAWAKCTFWNGSNRKKKVAMSNLMVAFNSHQRYNVKHIVSFYVPIKPLPQ